MRNPATKFQSGMDYFDPESIKEREEILAEFLLEEPYVYGMLLILLGVWNDNFCDGTCKHPLWLAKPRLLLLLHPTLLR